MIEPYLSKEPRLLLLCPFSEADNVEINLRALT